MLSSERADSLCGFGSFLHAAYLNHPHEQSTCVPSPICMAWGEGGGGHSTHVFLTASNKSSLIAAGSRVLGQVGVVEAAQGPQPHGSSA